MQPDNFQFDKMKSIKQIGIWWDSDADKLTDNLWFEFKTTNLSGEENTYQVKLETTEITKEVKK